MTDTTKNKIWITPLKAKAPGNEGSEMVYLIRIKLSDEALDNRRPGLNLALALDRSGSMSGRKLQKAKEAALYCVDQLLPSDFFSLTVFDHNVDVLLPPINIENRRDVKTAVERIRSGGNTALHSGWVQAGRLAAQNLDPQKVNRILLITDGLANEGETNPETIINQAAGLNERGVSTTTIGVGTDFNEDLLTPMAEDGGGNAWFVETAEDFSRIFETEMEGLVRESGIRVEMRLETEEGVKILDVLNDFKVDPERPDCFKLPNLMAGEPLDVVVKVSLPGGVEGPRPVFKSEVSWIKRSSGQREALTGQGEIIYAESSDNLIQDVNLDVQKAYMLLEAARAKKKAMAYMDRGDYDTAEAFLKSTSQNLMGLARSLRDEDFQSEADDLVEFSFGLRTAAARKMTRKKMVYQSTYRQKGRKEKK